MQTMIEANEIRMALGEGASRVEALTLRLDHWTDQNRWTGGLRRSPQDTGSLEDYTVVSVGKDPRACRLQARSQCGHENAAEASGGSYAREPVLCLRG
jgi:hypothetical protein